MEIAAPIFGKGKPPYWEKYLMIEMFVVRFFFKFLQVTISEPFFEYLYVEFITYFFHLSVISICRCQFPSGALTGNLNVDHAMCVLSLNIINDKIFLLEWIWFYVLALASSFSLISTAILVILPPSRKLWIRWVY